MPVKPPSPRGSRMETRSENGAALRGAIALSLLDLYSGVKVAQTSTPPADQVMMNSQTSAILTPPHWLLASAQWTLEECQSPVTQGPNMSTASGIISSAPVT